MIIEVKPWGRNVPIVLLGRLVNQLESAIESKDADEAIIVTKEKVDLPQEDIEKKGIRIMTLKELKNYLAHGRSPV